MTNDQELTQEIIKAIQIASVQGNLTKEAVDYVNKILEDNKCLKDSVGKYSLRIEEYKSEILSIKKENSKILEKEKTLSDRKREVSKRENKITELEMSVLYEKQRVKDHQDMFSLVFRNIETRKNVFTPVTGGTQYDGKQAAGFVSVNEQFEKNS